MSKNQGPYTVIDQWLEAMRQQGKSDHTLVSYHRAVSHFAQWSEMLYGQGVDPANIIGPTCAIGKRTSKRWREQLRRRLISA